MPCFRANTTAWLYEYSKKHMSKHNWAYSSYQMDIGSKRFKRAFATTAVKKKLKTIGCDEKERKEKLNEDI